MNTYNIKTYAAISLLLAGTTLYGCGSSSSSDSGTTVTAAKEGTAAYVEDNVELKGDFSEDVTLKAGTAYKINGKVNFLDGTTLTIPAGTTLYGSTPSSYLAINAGATIDAEGTAANPIVFTSLDDYNGTSTKDAQGEWGGLVLIGKAPIHGGTKVYEAGDQIGGGDAADDNSGTLKYVIIKHTGYEVEVDKELNGLSLLAVGSGTTISDIAVIGSADDGIEIWGGTVNLSNVYVYNAGDDSLDTDLGYTGTIDNAVAVQKVVDKTNYDSSGIESGNDEDDYTSSATITDPLDMTVQATMPTLKNATIDAVGGAVYLKNDSGYIFDNVLITTKASTVDGQADTADQAMVTHRTTDTVDDLSGTPYGVQIMSGGLVLNNEVNPEDIFAIKTAKSVADGGSDDSTHIQSYWLAAADITAGSYTGPMFVSATTLNDGSTAVDAGAGVKSTGGTAVTGADQSVFAWVLNELTAVTTEVVSSNITSNTTWTEGTNYALQGAIKVESGSTLTIEPGVTVYGLTPSSYMAIEPGAKLMAEGTQAKPITFTSAADVAGDNGDTIYQGQWGGLTLAGTAPIVGGSKKYEADETLEGGGTDPHDNSGSLKYVVLKNSGFEVEKDKELNGLSLLAVGDGTTIENIAILGGSDDGIEIWGGTVDVNGIYVYDAGDDSLDTDLGYTGTITNAYVQQYTVDKTNYDSSGIETGNDNDTYDSVGGVVDNTTSPVADLSTIQQATMATYKNVTIEAVGGAIYLKNDAGGIFDNVMVISKTTQDPTQTATTDQAIITHRTTDTVDDLSGSPYGVQVTANGLELVNEAYAGKTYATQTSKGVGDGGSTDANHIKNYWEAAPDYSNICFTADCVTGVTVADVWKGQAGTNDK